MIATLNASHSDYDFSNVLRPADFCREKRLKDVMSTVDSKIYSAQSSRIPRGLQTPGGSLMWGPRMWNSIDAEMDLYNCEIYSYKPEENPFDDEETALWSLHYFFFNKSMKRVSYLYARALSPSFIGDDDNDSDDNTVEDGSITPIRPKRRYAERQSADFSARKRARFWLGDRADDLEAEWESPVSDSADDDVDVELLDEIVKRGRSMSSNMSEDRDELEEAKERAKSHVRRMSESVAEAIEL
jgi:Maf1 regulator